MHCNLCFWRCDHTGFCGERVTGYMQIRLTVAFSQSAHACVRVCICCVVINLLLVITVICLNTFFLSLCICLTLNHHTFNLNFIHSYVTLMVCFKANFLLRTVKYYFTVSYTRTRHNFILTYLRQVRRVRIAKVANKEQR